MVIYFVRQSWKRFASKVNKRIGLDSFEEADIITLYEQGTFWYENRNNYHDY